MKQHFRQRLLASTLLVGAGALASPGLAQNASPQAQNCQQGQPGCPQTNANSTASPVQGTVTPTTSATGTTPIVPGTSGEIVVTGSRIASPNVTSISPVTVVSAQEVHLQGTTRTEDLLNSLPQVFANEGSTDSNGASGIATVDLRDLGPSRTLVLINGRRLLPGDPLDPVPDLNFIPSSLIKRVDVLTGGASSVYGSDALAGVVNFILDTDFTGVRVDGQVSVFNHNNRTSSAVTGALTGHGYDYPRGMVTNGGQQNVTLMVGADMGDDHRGHVTMYAGYRNVSAVTQGDRDFSSCGLSGSLNNVDNYLVCTGSSTSPTGRFRAEKLGGFAGGRPYYVPIGGSYTVDATTGAFRRFTSSDRFNFNPYNYFQRPDERYTLGAFGHYEISPAFDAYMEAMYMDDRTFAQIAPSGAFYGTDFFVNCDNPLLTATEATKLCGANAGTSALQPLYIGRRNVEGGGRVDDLRHTDYRIVTGLRGDIAKGISYDVYGQFSRSMLTEEYRNDFSINRLNRALDVVTNPATGQPACVTALPNANNIVVDPNCVPYNIFSPGGVTPAALNYLQTPGFQHGEVRQMVIDGAVTVKGADYGLISPWATRGIGLAAGVEYRKDSLELQRDIEFLTGDLAGQGTPFGVHNAQGSTNVKEIFGELDVPLVTERPFFHDLTLNLSGRHSKYNLAGSTNAYKAGLEWAPTTDARLRATYNRAVRAPGVLELFSPATVQLFSSPSGDPCTGATPVATLAQCQLSGVTPAEYGNIDANPASQYNQQTAGNPNLKPEVSDSYTVGLVLTPRFVPHLSASVDAYQIKVKKLIGTYGANFILNQCVLQQVTSFCPLIQRAAGSGSLFTGLSYVQNSNFNLGSEETRGVDVNVNYRTPPLFGRTHLEFDLVGSYLDKFYVQTLPGGGKYNCAGWFGQSCGTPLPQWRHKLRVTAPISSALSISAAWRYFSKVKNDIDQANPLVGTGPGSAYNGDLTAKLPAVSYFDLALVASIKKATFRVGAQNIFDKQPPLSPGYSNNGSNTYAQVYDSLGRYIYTSVTLDF